MFDSENGNKKLFVETRLKNNSTRKTLPLIPHIEKMLLEKKEQETYFKKIAGKSYSMNLRVSSAVTILESCFPLIMWQFTSIMLSLKTDFVLCVFMTWDIRVQVSCLRMMFRWKRFRNGSVIQTTQSQRTSTVTLNTMLRSSLRKQLWEYLTVNQSSRKFLLTTEFATKRISGRKSKSNTPKVIGEF